MQFYTKELERLDEAEFEINKQKTGLQKKLHDLDEEIKKHKSQKKEEIIREYAVILDVHKQEEV